MKALILAAGRGTRVRPITYTVPKPMIPILNKPVMEILIDLLARHGVREVMVNTSYLPTAIESYFRDGARFGVEMAYSFEGHLEAGEIRDEPVGSAGALKKIQEESGFFDETFVVMCGDAIVNLDLTRLVAFHRRKGALATIAVLRVPRHRVSSYGVAVTDDEGRILGFQEKPAVEEARSTTVNTGIYVFEPEILDLIPSGQPWDIGDQLFATLLDRKVPFYGADIPFQWLDIGNIPDYYRVMQMALRGEVNGLQMPGRRIAPGVWTGLNVDIDRSSVYIEPPVYIGGGTRVAKGATIIGPSMIGPGCVVEGGASIERSVVFDYTRISSLAEVSDMMVSGRHCVTSDGTAIDLSAAAIDWAVGDARAKKDSLLPDQLQMLELLYDVMIGVDVAEATP